MSYVEHGRNAVELLNAIGSRRSTRWFEPDVPVEPRSVERILATAQLASSAGNLQPWRAIVVDPARLSEADRAALLEANNRQRAQEMAPVWIYWFGDMGVFEADAVLDQLVGNWPVGAVVSSFGWSPDATVRAVTEGVAPPEGMPPMNELLHDPPPDRRAAAAFAETNGALQLAQLAALDEGLGCCLHTVCAFSRYPAVRDVLDVPEHFVPVWLMLLGHSAESPKAGGQRPRDPFGSMFSAQRWGDPMELSEEVAAGLRNEGLLQSPAPLPGRYAELTELAERFGYPPPEIPEGVD
jgi:nitroreductase